MEALPQYLDYLMERTRVYWFRGGALAHAPRLTISGFGIADPMPPKLVDRPGGTDDYLFMHFTTPAEVWHDGGLKSFPAHTFFLWEPGHRHTFGHRRRGWDHRWLHGSGTVLEEALSRTRIPRNRPVRLADSLPHDRAFAALADEVTCTTEPDWTILECVVRIWIRELERATAPRRAAARVPDRIAAAKSYIESHLDEPSRLEDLAAIAHLSVSHFCAEFKKHLGVPPIAFALELRLQRAAHLLHDVNLSVADVAGSVGIADAFYFSRQFKKRFGRSPARYRRRLQAT